MSCCHTLPAYHQGLWVQTKTRQAKVDYQEVHKKLRIITGSLAGRPPPPPAPSLEPCMSPL